MEELGQRMSSAELAEWSAFDHLYGIPDVYFQTGAIVGTLEGLWADKPRNLAEVIPYFGENCKGQSQSDMLGRLKMFASMKAKR